jgi:hypothetical protein
MQSLTFLDESNPNYSKSDGELMQQALDAAASKLGIASKDIERNGLARFVRAAFLIGNRDVDAIAQFTVDAVEIRRRSMSK